MRRPIVLSIIDQAVVSGFSFALMIALVAFTDAATVGHYAIYAAALLMAIGVHGALVAMPITVMAPGRTPAEQDEVLRPTLGFDAAGRLAAGIGAGGASALFDGPLIGLTAALMIVGALWRETIRARAIGDERMDVCLRVDATAIAAAAAAAVGLAFVAPPLVAVLGGLAIGNLASVAFLPVAQRGPLLPAPADVAAYPPIWRAARWGLAGSLATEAQDRGYVFIVAALRGEAAVGVLQTARIMTAPLTLSAHAWGRVARTRMAALIGQGDDPGARRVLWRGVAGLGGFAALALTALLLAWDTIDALVLRGRYPDVGAIAAVFGLYALLIIVSNAVSFYLQAAERFQDLARVSIVTSLVALGFVVLAAFGAPLIYSAWALVAGEAAALVWLLRLTVQRERVAIR